MVATWRALVLGGGGSTGEFQMGAMPVLTRVFDRFDFYAGVGVGALNTSVLAQYPDSFKDGLQVLLGLWARLEEQDDILDAPFGGAAVGMLGAMVSDKGFARDGVYGNRTLRRLIDEYVSWERLADRANWGIEITSLSDGLLYVISNDRALSDRWNAAPRSFRPVFDDPFDDRFVGRLVRDFIAAAGSVPLMLPPVDILGHRFVEGGLRDFLPLEVAIEAFINALQHDPTLSADFIVIDNYTAEIHPEAAELLDNGGEIMLRAIKIMTVEMAQNDVARARARLDALGRPYQITILRPRVDFRLHPLNFDDKVKRKQTRDEGATVASEAFPETDRELHAAIEHLVKDPDDQATADQIARLMRARPHRPLVPTRRPEVVVPDNLAELEATMRAARRAGRSVKAVGRGYAFSPICDTEGTAIELGTHLNKIMAVDAALLKEPAGAGALVELEAGATIGALNRWLWARGRALLNQPGYAKLSFLGVATTGGHGSGMRHGPLSEAIRALELRSFDAHGGLVARRIEPADGITDPQAWARRHPAIELVQDDRMFDAACVSFGTLGIITKLVIATQPAFFLEELRRLSTWAKASSDLGPLLADPQVHSVHVWLNPYPDAGENTVVVTENRFAKGPRTGHRAFGVTFGLVDELAPLLAWIMRKSPRAVRPLLDSSLRAAVPSGKPPIMPCWEALDFGTPNEVAVEPTNVGVPLADIDAVVPALVKFFAEVADGPQRDYITAPIGLRFTPPARALLSPQRGRATCMIELPFLSGTRDARQTIRDVQGLLFSQFAGRPHWGQIHDRLTPADMPAMFGSAWEDFKAVHRQLDPDGAFANATTKQLGLTP